MLNLDRSVSLKIIAYFFISCSLWSCSDNSTIKNESDKVSSINRYVFRDIADSIYHDIPAPKFLGYENGVDVTRFYKGKISSDININLLEKQLQDNGYNIQFLKEGKKMVAVYIFYTKGFIRRAEAEIYIEIEVDNISNFKATYASSLDI